MHLRIVRIRPGIRLSAAILLLSSILFPALSLQGFSGEDTRDSAVCSNRGSWTHTSALQKAATDQLTLVRAYRDNVLFYANESSLLLHEVTSSAIPIATGVILFRSCISPFAGRAPPVA